MTTVYKVTAGNRTGSFSGNEYPDPIDALRDCVARMGRKRPTRWSIRKGKHEVIGGHTCFTFSFSDPILHAETYQELSDKIRASADFPLKGGT